MKVALKINNDIITGYIHIQSEDYTRYPDYTVQELTQEQLSHIKTNHTTLTKLLNNDFSDNVMSEDEISIMQKKSRISELKQLLADTDYRAIKYAEGYYTEEYYAPYKALRQSYRDEINQLELELSQLDQSSTNEN